MTKATLTGMLLVVVAAVLAACGTRPSAGGGVATSVPTTAPAVAATKPAAAANDLYAGIEQGRTAEGYQMLGKANAPVRLVMYSDFF